jgi:hypothetical protein
MSLPSELLRALSSNQEIELDALPTIVAHFVMVEGAAHVFIANFSGLGPGANGAPRPVPGIRTRIPAGSGTKLVYLPFLGEQRVLEGTKEGDHLEFTLPPAERGAAVWIQK